MRINRLSTATAAAALSLAFAGQALAQATPAKPATPATPAAGEATAATPAVPATPAAPAAGGAVKVAAAGDIIETARASGQFTTFLKAVDATSLTSVLKTNKGLTVFAPTDAAFAALPTGKLDALMADKTALQKLLTHHVVNASVESSKIKGAKGPVNSVANDPIVLDGSTDVLTADGATIIQADIRATNGILHVVDKVLMPMGAAAAPAAAAAASTTAPDSAETPASGTNPAPKR